MEKKIAHLEMIQGVINRMGSNSFALKGWSVTLVAGIFALASKDANKMFFLITYIPIIIFWGLDAYYLLKERQYRKLFEKVKNTNEDAIDFNMNVCTAGSKMKEYQFCKCVFSKSEVCFYFPIAILCAVVIIIRFL